MNCKNVTVPVPMRLPAHSSSNSVVMRTSQTHSICQATLRSRDLARRLEKFERWLIMNANILPESQTAADKVTEQMMAKIRQSVVIDCSRHITAEQQSCPSLHVAGRGRGCTAYTAKVRLYIGCRLKTHPTNRWISFMLQPRGQMMLQRDPFIHCFLLQWGLLD